MAGKRNMPILPQAVTQSVSERSDTLGQGSSNKNDSVVKESIFSDQKDVRPLSSKSLSIAKSQTSRKLLESLFPKQRYNSLKSEDDINSFGAKIRVKIVKDYANRRPSVVVHTKDLDYKKKFGMVLSGNEFLELQVESSRELSNLPRFEILQAKNVSKLGLFFGRNNAVYKECAYEDFYSLDDSGSLFYEVVKVSTETGFPLDDARSVILTASLLKAGVFGKVDDNEILHTLNRLAKEEIAGGLSLALVFSARRSLNMLAQIILNWGAPVNSEADDDGAMPLEIAVMHKNIFLIELLLQQGADPDIELSSGRTSREVAKMVGLGNYEEIVQKNYRYGLA